MEYLMISGSYTINKIKGINCYDDKSYSKVGGSAGPSVIDLLT